MFTLFELKLQRFQLASDEQRGNALISCLPNDVLLVVHDLIINQPSYQGIKQRLLHWFEPFEFLNFLVVQLSQRNALYSIFVNVKNQVS